MINFIKKHKEYFDVLGISLLIFIVLFLFKGIYPLGKNTLIFGDMYDQITSYYYYLYDSIRGNDSVFINFASSNGINFFGIIAYYLLSPFSLLMLIVERNKIHLFISVVIVLKIILSNITCLYMIKKLFKNMNSLLSVSLAILYGFSAYSLSFYQITSWIDVMYMTPLIIIGLKKLFDENNPKLYIVTLLLSLYFSFYITFMVIIFIFLLSFPYLYVYHKKDEFGKKILSLGISTILSIGSSLFIVIPTYKQISISARMISSFESLLNSKLGPLTDKISLFLFGPMLFMALLFLIKNFKQNKKFLSFYITSMILLLLPVIVEPINKLLHFGSYASFPYRFGFITTLFIIIGAGYFFNSCKEKRIKIGKFSKIISIIVTIISSSIIIFITAYKYSVFQNAIDSLTFSRNKILIVLLVVRFIIIFIANIVIFILNKGINKLSLSLMLILNIVYISCNSFIYLGIDFIQEDTKLVYDSMNMIKEDFDSDIYFKLKDESDLIINNSSNITRIPSMDHFSSLTDDSNQKTLKLLGYTSYWTHTHSRGGTRFSDLLVANKYLLNNGEEVDGYKFLKIYNNLYLYELDKDISYGYLINKNVDIYDYNNTFDLQEAIYQSITDDNGLFWVANNIQYYNIEVEDNNYIVSDTKDNFIEFIVNVDKESEVYLELYSSLDNSLNNDIFELFNIYVNGEIYIENYPTEKNNGLLSLGKYKDDDIIVRVEFLNDCYLESLNIGVLDLDKLNSFIDNEKTDYDIEFIENKIDINIDSTDEKLLFIPINYNDSYTAYNNGKEIKIEKIYNSFIGIRLNKGENNISIKFVPSYLKISFIISILFVLLIIFVLRSDLYKKIINIKLLQKLSKYVYLGVYTSTILLVYLLPLIAFIISFVKYIKL